MKTMKWLLRREFWEHKGMFMWAPLALAGLMLSALVAVAAKIAGASVSEFTVNGHDLTVQVNGMTPDMRAFIGQGLAASYMAVAAPLLVLLALMLFFYCLGALYDDRRDRSILFWKSLPVSDRATVLSKLLVCLVVVPLLYLGVALVLSLCFLLVLSLTLLVKGINVFPVLFTSAELYTTPLQIGALLPVYLVWALPAVGWLLLVSSWARSKPFLWAVGVPVLGIVVLKYLTLAYHLDWNVDWFCSEILGRPLYSLIPGIWLPAMSMPIDQLVDKHEHVIHFSQMVALSYRTLAAPAAWLGGAAGAAMIAGAVQLRRWRSEA